MHAKCIKHKERIHNIKKKKACHTPSPTIYNLENILEWRDTAQLVEKAAFLVLL